MTGGGGGQDRVARPFGQAGPGALRGGLDGAGFLDRQAHGLGDHGSRQNPDIQAGHVKQMVRLFGVEECAKQKIQRLR